MVEAVEGGAWAEAEADAEAEELADECGSEVLDRLTPDCLEPAPE